MLLKSLIHHRCLTALNAAFPEHQDKVLPNDIEITEATQEKFGHYQCNSAMRFSKKFQAKPRDIAESWIASLEKIAQETDDKAAPLFSKIEIAGPGFINFTLSNDFLNQTLNKLSQSPDLLLEKSETPKRVVIDFSSPNTAKEMHVGHLRSTIIGDCLARLLSTLGHDVLRLNHVGDWGTQFGMIIAYLKDKGIQLNANGELEIPLPELANIYKAAKKRFDEEPDFKRTAQQEVVLLQGGNAESLRMWEAICATSRKAYNEIYELLDVCIEERGESFYNTMLPGIIEQLNQKGLIQESDGAQCVYLDGYLNRDNEPLPLMVQKSDGGYNYATTDLAGVQHRVTSERAHWIIYVTDAGQAQHFSMVFDAAKLAGFYQPEQVRIDHVPFGLVLREDGKKFKTRSGDTEKLIDLIHTAVLKAKTLLKERDAELDENTCQTLSQSLGVNAIKYADLSCNRTSNYVFSYDKMLKFEGNTAAFLMYAYVRIQGIKRKIGVDIESIRHQVTISLHEPGEIQLALAVCRFNDVLEAAANDLYPNRITEYLFHLAEKFHAFFHQCRVEGSEYQNSRLLLCDGAARTLAKGFHILGLKTVEKM